MPGIYGYVKRNKKDNFLLNMDRFMYYDDCFIKEKVCSNDFIEISHIHLNKYNKYNETFLDKNIFIAIEGEIYNYCNSDFKKLLFSAYINDSLENFLRNIDGYFFAVIYDNIKNKLFLINDRYGMKLAYYYFKNGDFAFSSEVKGLFGLEFLDKEISSFNVKAFFNLGLFPEDKTYFKNIKLLKPATILEFDLNSKNMHYKYYWKWSFIKQQKISFDNAVNKFGELFINSVIKRFNKQENIGISLSGGLDSRAIFAVINKKYPDFDGYAYTFGFAGSNEILIAKQVINKSKWKHDIFIFNDENWFEYRKKRVWITDGMFNILHMHGVEFISEISKNISINLNGFLGDAVAGLTYIQNIKKFYNKRITLEIAKKYLQEYVSESFVNDDYFDIPHIDPFLFANRGRRLINMGLVNFLDKIEQRIPFFDNELIEFIYSLPDEYRENYKLYKAMLLKFFPDFFQNIPWSRTNKPVVYGIYGGNKYVKKIENKILQFLKNMQLVKVNDGYTKYKEWIANAKIKNELLELLDRNNAIYTKFIDLDINEKYTLPTIFTKKDYSDYIMRAATIEIFLNYLKEFKIV